MAKNKQGRPTVMTKEVLDKLKEAFLWGCTDEEACHWAGIGTVTLYNYQNSNKDFLKEKELWKQEPFVLARKTIINALKIDADVALKYMERKKRDEFATKQVNENNDPVIEQKLDKVAEIIKELSNDAKSKHNKKDKTTS